MPVLPMSGTASPSPPTKSSAGSQQTTKTTTERDAVQKIEHQTYSAQCHCGLVAFAVTISPPLTSYKVMQCNCSICIANGYLLVYPYRSDVVFHGDSEAQVQQYRFHSKEKDHWFCKRCGTSLLIDFNGIHPNWDVLAVNVRTFQDVDLTELEFEYGDGKNL